MGSITISMQKNKKVKKNYKYWGSVEKFNQLLNIAMVFDPMQL